MVAARKKNRSDIHARALATSSALAGYYRQMYRMESAVVRPQKVIRILNEAGVRFVLMGTHGVGGWRSQSRATDDVDVLVAKKDHRKAVRVLHEGFPKLLVEDNPIVTRFKDPATGKPRIDLMKPLQKVYQIVFRHTLTVGASHRIPNLEMALISKFAAITSPHRDRTKKILDIGDFADIVVHNQEAIDMPKLSRLADQVYEGGRVEILQLVEDILAERPIQL